MVSKKARRQPEKRYRPKDRHDLHRRIKEQGGTISIRNNNHLLVITPYGDKVYMSATPSDIRAVMNAWSTWEKAMARHERQEKLVKSQQSKEK